MTNPFIKTSDSQTADKLIEEGFQLLSQSGGIYTFANDPSREMKVHCADDLNKFTYSNKLEF